MSVVTLHTLLLQEIKGLREELSTRFNSTETLELIREKEEQIRGLLEEGKDVPQTDQRCSRTFTGAVGGVLEHFCSGSEVL